MAESVLVNRKKFISSLDNKLVEPLNAVSYTHLTLPTIA